MYHIALMTEGEIKSRFTSHIRSMTEFLELQVAARNEVNAMSNELGEGLRDLFAAHMGQKVIKVTPYRTFTAKIKNELESVINDQWLRSKQMSIVFDASYEYSVYARLIKRFTYDERSHFQRCMIYVCSLQDLCVAEFRNCEPQRTDYTVQEVIEKRKRIAQLHREISDLKGSIRDSTDYTVQEVIEKRKRIAQLDREISELKGSIRDFERS